MSQVSYAAMTRDWMRCPVCASDSFEVLARVDRYRMGVPTCQCRQCGLVMTNPVPTEEALARFYRTQYRAYYRKVDRPSTQHIEEYGLAARATHTSAFLLAAGLLSGAPRVLDVGCAEGSLLRAIRTHAPDSSRTGVEPSPGFAEFAREWAAATVCADLAEVEQRGARFDLVVVNHVLEHVREPVAFLQRLAALTANDGAIYVDVPDAARYRSLDDLHIAHLFHFTAASLANVARRADLGPLRVEKHDPFRHPRSVRAILRRGSTGGQPQQDPEARVARRQIRRIALLAPAFLFRRSALGRALLNGPLRLWRDVSRAA